MKLNKIAIAAFGVVGGAVPMLAQAVNNPVTITFSTVASSVNSVPISPLAAGMIALAVGSLGYGALRSKGTGKFFSIAMSLALAGAGWMTERDALATQTAFTLTTSPDTQEANLTCKTDTFTNGTGSTIQILSVTDVGNQIDNSSTCKANVTLTPNQTCQLVAVPC